MASVTTPRLMTAEEFGQLDDVLGFRDELIEGERVLSPSPILKHTALIAHLAEILEHQLPALSQEPHLMVREAGWRFRSSPGGPDNVPVPDLMVIRVDDYNRALKTDGWFEGIPLIVIEVISPSERKARRMQKVGLYLDMGVPQVVEVDYRRQVVRVHTPDTDSLAVYRQGDQLHTPFEAAVGEIFSILD